MAELEHKREEKINGPLCKWKLTKENSNEIGIFWYVVNILLQRTKLAPIKSELFTSIADYRNKGNLIGDFKV